MTPKPHTTRLAAPQHSNRSRWLLPLRLIYALYAAATFFALLLVALLLCVVVPTLAWRRRSIRRAAHCALLAMGMPVRVKWVGVLPEPCIVVANHCSYLDGVVLAAILPPRFGFVIKREMNSVPLAGFLLSRIGVEFVARGNRAGSTRDALRVMRSATRGRSLAFFPEGTFQVQPGLLRFHIGAFAAAARAGAPVVPVIIRGTRRCLAPESMLPLPGYVEVIVLAPIAPQAAEPPMEAADLRDAARAAILSILGEPDLANHTIE